MDSVITDASLSHGYVIWLRSSLTPMMVMTSGCCGCDTFTHSFLSKSALLPFLKQPNSTTSEEGTGRNSYLKMYLTLVPNCEQF